MEATKHLRVLPRLRRGQVDGINEFNVSTVKGKAIRIFGRVAVHEFGQYGNCLASVVAGFQQFAVGDLRRFKSAVCDMLLAEPPIGEMGLVLDLLKDAKANLPIICDLLGAYGSCWAEPFLDLYANPSRHSTTLKVSFDRQLVVGDRCRLSSINDWRSPYIRPSTWGRAYENCVLTGISAKRVKFRVPLSGLSIPTFGPEKMTDFYTFAASNWREIPK